MVVIGLVPVLTSSSSAIADPGTILQFDVMTPVTGPYVGTANPIRTVPGGGMPWVITSGTGFLCRASMAGNSEIRARVKLPEPCIAPIVFVASPAGAWFAATGG